MNPYFKYPLIGFVVFCLLLIFVVKSCGKSKDAPVVQPPQGTVVPPEGAVVQPEGTVVKSSGTAEPITPPPVAANSELETKLARARGQLDLGYLEAARQLARLVLHSSEVREFDPTWRKAANLIDEADKRLMNSTAPASEKQKYRVVAGDNLTNIARAKRISIASIARINESVRNNNHIRPSQTLMYIPGKWSIRVSKQHYLLLLYLNDELYRVYTVGIGKENRTPAGTFLITDMTKDPTWYRSDGKIISFGDTENLLGTRWLKLTPTDDTDPTLEGYGIHGTWEPESCGTSCSSGCVRMRNEEVEELFDFIPQPGGSNPPVRVVIEE
ncbi:MAG: L,D-transpeptidase family protein [Victivallales bacterium]|nr:L,D-transpeptidase family protein [Victivallales bacterium]